MKTQYEECLKLFVGEDASRKWMTAPFFNNGFVVATNGVVLIAVPDSILAGYKQPEGTSVDVIPILDNPEPLKINILVSALEEAIKDAPKKDDLVVNYKMSVCGACNGEGTTHYKKTYYETCDCPVCEGDGEGYEAVQYPVLVRGSLINAGNIQKLICACKMLGVDNVDLVKQGANCPNHFKIAESTVVIMPMDLDYHESVCKIDSE